MAPNVIPAIAQQTTRKASLRLRAGGEGRELTGAYSPDPSGGRIRVEAVEENESRGTRESSEESVGKIRSVCCTCVSPAGLYL